MDGHDPTTPLDDLASHDQPTINRPSPAPTHAARGFAPGTVVAGRYRIVALLGRGGMGEVYRADDLRLGQPVALKFVDLGSDERSIENLYHEVRVARQVSHPNVCRVHDVVEAEGHRFIAMEYVDGEDLASLLHRIGRLPAAKAIEVAREIAAGLAAAHDRGITHRDLKPANVMIDGNGRAHVTDFGLASLAGTHDGLIAGTAAYMAPEQIDGQPVTPQTDVYAFGLMLYELITGERVYPSTSLAERRQRRALTPRPVSASVKDVDRAIDAVIAACLSEDPALRPANARAVLAMLPGGDAIDAAMAAGETPSPEMVAAAAETGELPLHVTASVVAGIVVLLLVVAWQSQSSLFTLMRKPPEVFVDRAAEIVKRAEETSVTRDEAYYYDYDRELPRPQLAAMRPGVMHFVYRRSPARMAPRESVQAANASLMFQSGRITMDDPALDPPGSAIVVLDHHGALISYRAHPSGRSGAPDWRPLLEATGIDSSTLVPAKPSMTPPVASDARAAWTAAYRGQRERVQIEAASLNGQPAWLHVHAPWHASQHAAARPQMFAVQGIIQFIVSTSLGFVAAFAVLRSLRRGRSDRSGAFRLALYVHVCLFLAWLIAAHHSAEAEDEARMLTQGFGQAAGAATFVWLAYIALEPGVRRTWPRALIGWTRLLSGRFRDAMVGREILLGIGGGIAVYELLLLSAPLRARIGRPSAAYVTNEGLNPLAIFVGDRLIGHVEAFLIAIGFIFLYLLTRKAFGPRGGLIVYALLILAWAYVVPGVLILMTVLTIMLLRSGLLTGVAMTTALNLISNTPLTLDTRAWYWPRALVVMLIVTAIAVWAARTATAQRVR